ncbi:hypothetical protein ACFQ2B_15145 [Streptomyces stramineus]
MSKENPRAPRPADRAPARPRARSAGPPPVSYVVDTRTGRLGQVMDRHAGYLQLRPRRAASSGTARPSTPAPPPRPRRCAPGWPG